MKHILLCTLAIFLFFGSNNFANASGKAFVKKDQKVVLDATSNIQNPTIQWVVKKGDAVVSQMTGKTFSASFSEVGTYTINTTATNQAGTEIERTAIELEVAINPPVYARVGGIIETVPVPNAEDGKVHLFGSEAAVAFYFAKSSGDISEFRFDGDVFEDSDSDGIIDNDIENKGDPSFFSGNTFSRVYKNTGKPIRARLIVVDKEKREQIDTIDIVFDEKDPALQARPLRAILQTLPQADENGIIHVSGNEAEVTFYSGSSEGSVNEYRIDKNLNMDANGDSDKKNDIDNLTDQSFKNGQPWITSFKKEWEPIVVQLMVVEKSGKGSLVQRKIVFDGEAKTFLPILIASQEQVVAGDSVTFRVFNAPEGTKYSWDFTGDGSFEKEKSDESEIRYRFGDTGTFSVLTRLEKEGSETINLGKTITVKAVQSGESNTNSPKATFSFTLEKNTVSFDASESTPDNRLSNQDLSYSWEFGDGSFGVGKTVQHTYSEIGDFVPILRVEDSVQKESRTSHPLSIGEIAVTPLPSGIESPVPQSSESPAPSTPPASTSSTFSLPWWLIFLLIILILPLGYFAWKKINDPDKSFEEIWNDTLKIFQKREEKESEENILEAVPVSSPEISAPDTSTPPDWLRTHESDEKDAPAEALSPEETQDSSEVENEEEILIPETQEEDSQKVPSWLQTQDTQENSKDDASDEDESLETETEVLPEENTEEASPDTEESTEEDTTPDWLKSDDEKEESLLSSEDSIEEENTENTSLPEEGNEAPEESTVEEETTPQNSSEEPAETEATPDWLSEEDEKEDVTPASSEDETATPEEGTNGEELPEEAITEIPEEAEGENAENTPLPAEEEEPEESAVEEEPSPQNSSEEPVETEATPDWLSEEDEKEDSTPAASEDETAIPEEDLATAPENSEVPEPDQEVVETSELSTADQAQKQTEVTIPDMPPLEPIAYEEGEEVPNWLSEKTEEVPKEEPQELAQKAIPQQESTSNISGIVESAKKDLPDWLREGVETPGAVTLSGGGISLSPLPPEEIPVETVSEPQEAPLPTPQNEQESPALSPENEEEQLLENPEESEEKILETTKPEEILLPSADGAEDALLLESSEEPLELGAPQEKIPESAPALPQTPSIPLPVQTFSEDTPPEEGSSEPQTVLPEWLRTGGDQK